MRKLIVSEFVTLDECLVQSDVLILGACHSDYRDLRIEKPVVDVFGFLKGNQGTGNTA